MKATDPRYHVGLGIVYEHGKSGFSFDRTATFADLWRLLFHNLLRHPIRTTIRAGRFTSGGIVSD